MITVNFISDTLVLCSNPMLNSHAKLSKVKLIRLRLTGCQIFAVDAVPIKMH